MTEQERKLLKRRQAIEPIIGHLKVDHRINWHHLKGSEGYSFHAVLCAAGYNIRWLLRMIAKKGVGGGSPAKCLWFRELEAQIASNSCHELKHPTYFSGVVI